MRYQMTMRYPAGCQKTASLRARGDTHLQRHQQALAFNIGEAQVHATWITVDITIAYDSRTSSELETFGAD